MHIRTYLVALAAAILFVSCGSCGQRPPPGPTPAQIEQAKAEALEQELKDDIARFKRFAKDHPEDIAGVRRRVNNFLLKAKGTSYADQAKRILTAAEKSFRELCERYREKVLAVVQRYIEDEDFATALEKLKMYNPEMLLPEIETELEEMQQRFEREIKADDDYFSVKSKVDERIRQGDFERALATINAFLLNPQYAGTMAAKRMEPLVKEIDEKKAASAEMKVEEERGWEVLFDGKDASNWDYGGTDEHWSVVGEALIAKNNSESPIVAMTGNEDWKDYYVKFRFKLVTGEFYFGCRGGADPGGDEWSFHRSESPGRDYDKGKWYEIRCEVVGPRLTWIRRDNLRSRIYEAKRPAGPIAFLVLPGAEVHIKGVQIKHQ